jgi:hypothetical protein
VRVYLITLKRSAESYHLYDRFHGFVVVAKDERSARNHVIRYMRERGYTGEPYRHHRMEYARDAWSTALCLGPAAPTWVKPGVVLADNTGS